MRRYQFSVTDSDSLKDDLLSIKSKINSDNYSNVLFRVYCTLLDEKMILDTMSVIADMYPDALINGCTTRANVDSGEIAESDVFVVCDVMEDPDTKMKNYLVGLEGRTADEVIKFMIKEFEANPWIRAVELLSTMSVMASRPFNKSLTFLARHAFVFGGGAINKQVDVSDTWVYTKEDGISRNGIMAVVYGGENLYTYSKTIVGWRPLGKNFKVTSAKDNILYTLDDEPAFETYSKYLKINNNEIFLDNSMEFPMLFKSKEGNEILRTGMVSNSDGSVEFASTVEDFVSARLTFGSQDNIMLDAYAAAEEMAKFEPQVINAYSCFGRMQFLGDKCTIDIRPFEYLGNLAGYFTSGELSTDNKGNFIHHNETLVVVGLREGNKRGMVKVFPKNKMIKTMSLGARLVNFIEVATSELAEANRKLEELVEEVSAKQKEADSANKAKSEFLANMSHEIRTPINAILGFDTMILRESNDDNITKYALDIHNASDNLLSIINDILDLSKVESGKMEIIKSKYELSSVINDVMNMFIIKGVDKGLTVNLSVDPEIPAWLEGDAVRLRQILVNLMNNAIKYTEKGSVSLEISGVRDGKTENLHFAVKDTGAGIKKEDMGALFEKFKRIEEAKNANIEGTGLGMSITIMLLGLMGSEIKVDSVYGEGSTFSFDLKQKIVRNEPIGDVAARFSERRNAAENYEQTFKAEDAKILLVDDNSLNRKVIISLLKEICKNITEADGGYPAIEEANKAKYDLILLDHMMPDLDGIEAFHKIREESIFNKETPVIMLTANAIVGAKEEYLGEGFEAFLSKPVDPEKLEALLLEFLPEELIEKCSRSDRDVKKGISGGNLPEIEGIELGFARLKLGNDDNIRDAMNIFCKSAALEANALKGYKESSINDSINSSTLKNFEIKVHAMKSSLAVIGAMQLSGVARELEFAGKRKDLAIIKALTDTFLTEYLDLADRIREAIVHDEEGKQAVDASKYIKLLDKLSKAINNMDIDEADSVMEKLKKYDVSDEVGKLLEMLDAAVAGIDLEEVGRLTGEIKGILK